MTVDYLHPVWGTFAQYCRSSAGYYPDMSRRARREIEIAAWAAGVQQFHALPVVCGVPHGAPGLLGGAPSQEELAVRRAKIYPAPGKLP